MVIGESVFEYPDLDDIDFELDTDEDGLPDYYEDILGTDKNKADTDGDGLSDGYEVFYLGTDPLKADSDDNGVNDGDEDNDNDGLTNAKEQELGTDPNNDDTDGDGLSDGAEVNTHKTDPLKYDTDGDNISDGDEIALGLDPNSGSTNGIPDSERTFTQTVNADSEVFSLINEDEETPFKVSLEMKSAGVAEKNLSAYESGYSAVMQNDAVIGIIPQFSYTSGLNVEEVKVKFELDNSITGNTLGTFAEVSSEFTGIKRLNIFKYFEDVNMLLPVETFHDTNNNVVYTVTDCLGTYCLMDMEIWLDSLGISSASEKAEVEESGAMSQNSIDNDNYMCYNINELNAKANDSENKDSVNVVFIIDTRESQEQLENVKKEILDISRTVLKNSPDGRIYIFEQNTDISSTERYKVYSAKGNRFFTNYNDLLKVLSAIEANGSVENNAVLSDPLEGVLSVCDLSRETYVFSLFNQENVMYRENNGYSLLDAAVERNVDISVIAKIDNSKKYGYAHDMYKKSGGIFIADTGSDYSVTVLKHIYGKIINEEEEGTGEYNMILATGLRNFQLKAPITEEYALLALEDEIDETQPDTDEDDLPDYMEINFKAKDSDGTKLIRFVNGVVDLPTYSRCISCKSELTYVQQGLYRFDGQLVTDTRFINYLDNCGLRVLPIVSDPNSEDGDGDRINDRDEYLLHPLEYEILPCLGDIEEMAKEYNKKKSFDLTCQFIRHFKYNKDTNSAWESATGKVDEKFIEYVKGKNSAIFDFYERCSVEEIKENYIALYDPITHEKEDFVHLFATLNAMSYKGATKVLSNSEIVNDLLGWAGDLQSMIQTDLLIYYEDNMYETNGKDRYFEREYLENLEKDVIFITMYNLLQGCNDVTLNGYNLYNTAFRNSDLLADADAVNMYSLKRKWKNISVNDLINLYFSSVKNDNERFDSFIRNIAGNGDDGYIYGKMLYYRALRYTNENIQSDDILEVIAFTNSWKWKLFRNAPVTQNVSEECARAFTVYIFERAGRVYEYE